MEIFGHAGSRARRMCRSNSGRTTKSRMFTTLRLFVRIRDPLALTVNAEKGNGLVHRTLPHYFLELTSAFISDAISAVMRWATS